MRTSAPGTNVPRVKPFKTWREAFQYGRFHTTNGYTTEQVMPFKVYKSGGFWCVTFTGVRIEYVPPPPPPPKTYDYEYVVTVNHVPGDEPKWPDWVIDWSRYEPHYCD